MAYFPGSIPPFTTKVDITDVVFADHVNKIQNEVIAMATTVGVNPHIQPLVSPSTSFISAATVWPNLGSRLANIENGVGGDSHIQYVKKSGGSTISSSGSGIIGLITQAITAQTADLVQYKDVGGTVGVAVNKDAQLIVGGAVVPSVAVIEELKGAFYLGGNLGGL